MSLTSPDGKRITIRPVDHADLDRAVLRCWPDRQTLDRLFATQGTIGMAAWESGQCVAQLHCYQALLPKGGNPLWPEHNNWLPGWASGHLARLGIRGPAWCHACCHVGRTLKTFCSEILGRFLLPQAHTKEWGHAEIIRQLGTQIPNASEELAREVLDDISRESPTIPHEIDGRYFGRGIGTALCRASVSWARDHGYLAVLALGAPEDLFEYDAWSGHVPWTTYVKLGFEMAAFEPTDGELPAWAQGSSPPEVMAQVRASLAAGRAPEVVRERLMVLHLKA